MGDWIGWTCNGRRYLYSVHDKPEADGLPRIWRVGTERTVPVHPDDPDRADALDGWLKAVETS